MRRFKAILLVACVLGFGSCDKLMTYYDIDTDAYAYADQTILEYFESGVDPACTDFCRAVRLAGLESEIEAGGRTCIIPNNDAFAEFLSQAGYQTVDAVPAPVLRDLLLYLIFPGDYRSTNMEPGANYRQISLRGDSIFIGRSESAQTYRVYVNAVSRMESITVAQQDYLFKNNMIGQVVGKMPLYKVELPATDSVPEGYEPEGVQTAKIDVSDDTCIYTYGSQKDTNFNNHAYGVRLIYRSGSYAYGLMRFPLPDLAIVEDLVSAQLVMNVTQLGNYTEGTECKVSVSEANPLVWNQWTESSATWNNVVRDLLGTASTAHRNLPKTLAGEAAFVVGPSADVEIAADITASVLKYYELDSTYVDYVLSDGSAKAGSKGVEIRLKDKDYYKFTSYILLTGPAESPLTVRYNTPLVTTGTSTVFGTETLMIDPPADPGQFDFSARNVILQLSDLPAKGVLTLYGVPVQKNQKFTLQEMEKGFVRYVRTEEGADEFKLKVLDYLNGMMAEKVTITVQ